MRGTNSKVTLWRKRWNDTTKKDEFTRVIIPVICKWDAKTIRTATDKGANIAQYISVVVPYSDDFVLDCNVGDYMALGEQTVDITGVSPYTVSEVKTLLAPDFMQVKAVADNTKNALGKHYFVEGVQ